MYICIYIYNKNKSKQQLLNKNYFKKNIKNKFQ